MARKSVETSPLKVLRAIEDPVEGVWLEITDGTNTAYMSRSELVGSSTDAFKRLERQGIPALLPATQRKIRASAESITIFDRTARVATRPGWVGSAYVLPDGKVLRPPGEERTEILVQFAANPKCMRSKPPKDAPSGLAAGNRAIAPLVSGQALLTTSILISLAGPLMRLVDYTAYAVANTGFDLVGPPNLGKTQWLAISGATWGDEPQMRRGYADAWSGTVAATLARVVRCNDGFAGFDDTSVAMVDGAIAGGKVADIATKVMMLADGAERDRYTDPAQPRPSRFLYLSTGNRSLADALSGHADVVDAHSTRLVTLELKFVGEHGIFDRLPKGMASALEAGNALDKLRKRHHGWLGLEFVSSLVKARADDEKGLVADITRYMEEFHTKISTDAQHPPIDRIWRPLALAYAAGRLAKKWKVIPSGWGNFLDATTRVYGIAIASLNGGTAALSKADPLDRVEAYLRTAKAIDLRKKKVTLTREQVLKAPGILYRQKSDQLEFLMSRKRMVKAFPDHEKVIAALRAAGKLAFEKDKVVVYRSIRGSGKTERDRVYAIRVKRNRNGDGCWETRLA